eukprot:4024059-Amphidinium_carterae.1
MCADRWISIPKPYPHREAIPIADMLPVNVLYELGVCKTVLFSGAWHVTKEHWQSRRHKLKFRMEQVGTTERDRKLLQQVAHNVLCDDLDINVELLAPAVA